MLFTLPRIISWFALHNFLILLVLNTSSLKINLVSHRLQKKIFNKEKVNFPQLLFFSIFQPGPRIN